MLHCYSTIIISNVTLLQYDYHESCYIVTVRLSLVMLHCYSTIIISHVTLLQYDYHKSCYIVTVRLSLVMLHCYSAHQPVLVNPCHPKIDAQIQKSYLTHKKLQNQF